MDSVLNQMLCDQFIRGINDARITEHLLTSGAATLKDVTEKADGIRQAMLDSKELSSCLLYTSPSPRDRQKSRMPSSA